MGFPHHFRLRVSRFYVRHPVIPSKARDFGSCLSRLSRRRRVQKTKILRFARDDNLFLLTIYFR
jgi:hypothetical protein